MESCGKGEVDMKYIVLTCGLLPVVILAVIGALIRFKKAYWLISGYNTMSREKKEKVDIEGLGRFTGNICFVYAAVILAAIIFMVLNVSVAALVVFALLLPLIIYTLVKAQQYDGNTRNEKGEMNRKTKWVIASISLVVILTAAGVGTLLYYSSKPAEYSVENGVFSISGLYGQKIQTREISDIQLKESLPEILMKTNGSALGDKYKGHFKLKDVGKATVFLDRSQPPFIYIKAGSKVYFLNCNEPGDTKALFEKLQKEREKSGK